jgi:hypothetical protein
MSPSLNKYKIHKIKFHLIPLVLTKLAVPVLESSRFLVGYSMALALPENMALNARKIDG